MSIKKRLNANANSNNALQWTEDLNIGCCAEDSTLQLCKYSTSAFAKTSVSNDALVAITIGGVKYTFDNEVDSTAADAALQDALVLEIDAAIVTNVVPLGYKYDGGVSVSVASGNITVVIDQSHIAVTALHGKDSSPSTHAFTASGCV